MSHPPLCLTARDFDAYAPEKATSNAFSRPRLETKQRALAWARGVVARLDELGISVDLHGSDEHPTLRNKKRVDCQWVFFWRDQAARDELEQLLDQGRSIAAVVDDPSPYTRHAFLGLRLDSRTVEVCFAVHPEARVDVDNLRARLAGGGEEALARDLMAALRGLPDEFTIGVGPGGALSDRVACVSATPAIVRQMLEGAAAGQVPLWIGWSVARETAIEHSAILDEQFEDAIVALAPIYRLVAWSRQNDHIGLEARIETIALERARVHAEAAAQTEKWHAERAEARQRELERGRARSDEAWRSSGARLDTLFQPAGAIREESAGAIVVPAKNVAPPDETSAKAPAGPGRAATPAIEKGAKVRVLSGPFAEKVGVIAELDGRGGARVLLGLLSTRLEVADLEPVVEGRERPAFQSSHRKPGRDAASTPKARANAEPATVPRKAR